MGWDGTVWMAPSGCTVGMGWDRTKGMGPCETEWRRVDGTVRIGPLNDASSLFIKRSLVARMRRIKKTMSVRPSILFLLDLVLGEAHAVYSIRVRV